MFSMPYTCGGLPGPLLTDFFEFEDLSVFEINRFRYEISIHFFDQEITFSTVKSKMIYFFQSLFENSQILQITDLDISVNSKKLVHYKTTNENQFSISINADMIFKYLFAIFFQIINLTFFKLFIKLFIFF